MIPVSRGEGGGYPVIGHVCVCLCLNRGGR